MIKYLGSKRTLVPHIVGIVQALGVQGTVLDLFSGTSRVGHALKAGGFRVLANDHNAYAATLGRCYVQADAERWESEAKRWIAELSELPGRAGWFTELYSARSRFIQPHNAARIEVIRDAIAAAALHPDLEAILLVSLLEAADRVDSTTGVQMAYLKQWAPRSFRALELRMPRLVPTPAAGSGAAHELDALVAARSLEADIAYLDPPYNQHKYLGNYHVWETLVRWDQPEVYGVACKRVDCRVRPSLFNRKRDAVGALSEVIRAVRARHLVVSFNDEGYVHRSEIEAVLSERGEVVVSEHDFPRYVGARIGVYNPAGARVGQPGHLRNTEHIFVVSPDADVVRRVRQTLSDQNAVSTNSM